MPRAPRAGAAGAHRIFTLGRTLAVSRRLTVFSLTASSWLALRTSTSILASFVLQRPDRAPSPRHGSATSGVSRSTRKPRRTGRSVSWSVAVSRSRDGPLDSSALFIRSAARAPARSPTPPAARSSRARPPPSGRICDARPPHLRHLHGAPRGAVTIRCPGGRTLWPLRLRPRRPWTDRASPCRELRDPPVNAAPPHGQRTPARVSELAPHGLAVGCGKGRWCYR